MAKKGGSFNPFGGLFDFNRDGREDFAEQWLALKIVEECTKQEDQVEEDWTLPTPAGNYAAAVFDETAEGDDSEEPSQPVTITIHIEIPGMEALNAIRPTDYPNKRKYDAAYHLCDVQQGTAYVPEDTSEEAEIERCRFILNSDTVAAQYLTVYDGFLYAQAIKDHFSLPIDVPDEDEIPQTCFSDLLRDVANIDPQLAVEIWGWCIKQFGPYQQYMQDHQTLYHVTMCEMQRYPDAFLDIAARTIGADAEFREGLLTKGLDFAECCASLIARALKLGLPEEASRMFDAAIRNPDRYDYVLGELIDQIIVDCSDWEELETMERFQQHLLPVIHKMENAHIQQLYPRFAQKAADYISYVESTGERYRYARKFAWRKNCQDGAPYDLDPLDYETETEYNQAIYEEKYGWRFWAAADGEKFGIDPAAFETEDEFYAVYDQAWKEDLQKRRCAAAQNAEPRHTQPPEPLPKKSKGIYTYCGVVFGNGRSIYHYRTEDDTIAVGDRVVVPVGWDGEEAVAEVVTVQKHRLATAPYPVERTKMIKGRFEG